MENPFEELNERLIRIENILLNRIEGKPEFDKYFKIDKASEFLSTTPNALRVMVNKNKIPFIKKMGKLFFRESDLVEWLEMGACDVEFETEEESDINMDIDEIASYLKCSKSTIHRYKNNKVFPFYKAGRTVYFKKSEIDKSLLVSNNLKSKSNLISVSNEEIEKGRNKSYKRIIP